jgi:hypothetical protein
VAVGVVGRLWRGEVSLRAAFWLCGVLGAIAVQAALTPVELWPDRARAALGNGGIAALAGLAFVYAVFSAMAVWHSADRYRGPRHHVWLARIGMGVILFATVIDVASGLIVAFGA